MARSVDTIQKAIIDDVAAQPEFSPLVTNTSKRSIWRLWTYVVAVAINLLEQLQDLFKSDVEKTVSLSAPATPQWIQDKVFKFQYSATDPQIIKLIDLVPQYPVVNPDLRIVTRCSVRKSFQGGVLIKVAKGDPPAPLTSLELSALQSYIQLIGTVGIIYQCLSTQSDKLYLEADIYFQGQYSSVIQQNVIDKINSYLSSIPFDGVIKILDLELAIRSVEGVNDMVTKNIKARQDSQTFAQGTYLVLNKTVIGRLWNTVSGYIVPETTTGYTLQDSLNFISE